MKTLQRAITAVTLAAVMICMAANIKAKADTIEASEVLAADLPGADLTSIAYAYNNLTTQQKLIADYLLGAYNYTYLCARGFSFNIDQNETNMKAQLGAIGNRVWQYMTTAYAWRSRFNEVFRQYASSIIVYSSKITDTFDIWINDILSGNRNVYIEYSEDAFDAWTEFYNDPSGDGIASFGMTVSNWDSGDQIDFIGVGFAWGNSNAENEYNNFILDYSPVLYTKDFDLGSGNSAQCVIGFKDKPVYDTLYVQRSNTSYKYFRFGFSDLSYVNNERYPYIRVAKWNDGKLYINQSIQNILPRNNIIEYSGSTSINDIIQYAFYLTPFSLPGFNGITVYGYYPLIEHVYLVDDLTTLSNAEEIENVDSFNIMQPGIADYIITPNGKMLIPGYAPMTDPFADLWDVSVDENNNTVSEDDFDTQIVNNTVINNYVIDASDKINVPVDWFDNPSTDQLANDSIPFLSFARDCIDCLGNLQLYFYGAIVFGLGGGILKKLIL